MWPNELVCCKNLSVFTASWEWNAYTPMRSIPCVRASIARIAFYTRIPLGLLAPINYYYRDLPSYCCIRLHFTNWSANDSFFRIEKSQKIFERDAHNQSTQLKLAINLFVKSKLSPSPNRNWPRIVSALLHKKLTDLSSHFPFAIFLSVIFRNRSSSTLQLALLKIRSTSRVAINKTARAAFAALWQIIVSTLVTGGSLRLVEQSNWREPQRRQHVWNRRRSRIHAENAEVRTSARDDTLIPVRSFIVDRSLRLLPSFALLYGVR